MVPFVSAHELQEDILDLLKTKMIYEDPNNEFDYAHGDGKKAKDEFMRKHSETFAAIGKEEVFYHLELSSSLYSDTTPGLQPHAMYVLYLYNKFYDDYSNAEKTNIHNQLEEFVNRGWVREADIIKKEEGSDTVEVLQGTEPIKEELKPVALKKEEAAPVVEKVDEPEPQPQEVEEKSPLILYIIGAIALIGIYLVTRKKKS
tara:strand:+ start:192 stop:797 length:606 start_codon:yes stop_codon:yes gene_type:complete